tara:strand:- start:419 stop:619 length:201 start_codon:yes stop_codon:yes gene_type:complete
MVQPKFSRSLELTDQVIIHKQFSSGTDFDWLRGLSTDRECDDDNHPERSGNSTLAHDVPIHFQIPP